MPTHQHRPSSPGAANSGDGSATIEKLRSSRAAYGNRFLLEPAPDNRFPSTACARSTRCA